MKVMVATENRFYKSPTGMIYSSTVCDYNFWKRYLQSFDQVIVFARVGTSRQIESKHPANGPGVTFYELPMYIGPWQYLRQRKKILKLSRAAVELADVFILRSVGAIGTVLWNQLKKKDIPYGVEVIGSSYDSLKTANINPIVESLLYFWQLVTRSQRRQCAGASVAAYVTRQYLQGLYPPGGWNTYYSSIDLPPDAFVTDELMIEKQNRLRESFENKRPFTICHAASMDARYKAQDALIRSVAICRRHKINVELKFLGDGKYRGYYESVARQEGIADHVTFHGRIASGKPVRDLMDQADLFVFPSLTEGLPRSLIEAMARGLPCVASRVGGIPELLDEEFLVPAGKVTKLVDKLMELFSNLELLLRASARNREKAQEYSASVLNLRRVAFYEKLIEMTRNHRKL